MALSLQHKFAGYVETKGDMKNLNKCFSKTCGFNLSEYLQAMLIYCYRHARVRVITAVRPFGSSMSVFVRQLCCVSAWCLLLDLNRQAVVWRQTTKWKDAMLSDLPLNNGRFTSEGSSCCLAKYYKGILPKHVNTFLRKSVTCLWKFWGLILCSPVNRHDFLKPTISLF